jgi:hypothetical protein
MLTFADAVMANEVPPGMSPKERIIYMKASQPLNDNHPDPVMREMFNKLHADRARRETERPKIEAEGEAALHRLYSVACRDSGQCRCIARFLLGLYNGQRFPFALTELRGLDDALFEDCMAVLRMDARVTAREIHEYFDNGGRKFEQLAKDWNIADMEKARHDAECST